MIFVTLSGSQEVEAFEATLLHDSALHSYTCIRDHPYVTKAHFLAEMNRTILQEVFSHNLKVSISRKQVLKFSFEPKKNERNYFCIPALSSKMGQIIKLTANYHAN